jgi:hypothetical protein
LSSIGFVRQDCLSIRALGERPANVRQRVCSAIAFTASSEWASLIDGHTKSQGSQPGRQRLDIGVGATNEDIRRTSNNLYPSLIDCRFFSLTNTARRVSVRGLVAGHHGRGSPRDLCPISATPNLHAVRIDCAKIRSHRLDRAHISNPSGLHHSPSLAIRSASASDKTSAEPPLSKGSVPRWRRTSS